MTSFVKQVTSVILKADVLLLVLDARAPEQTRNARVERIIHDNSKRLIYVINKSDLVPKNSLKGIAEGLEPCVFVSMKDKTGINYLRDMISMEGKKAGIKERDVLVGVLGYPNVGKSSIINTLSNRKAAPASNVAGTTRGVRLVRSRSHITLIDTPGVIPQDDKNESKNALIGSVDFTKVKDPESVVFEIMETHPNAVERYFSVPNADDPEEVLESIALKKRVLKKGGEPDTSRMARMILQDWQNGVFR